MSLRAMGRASITTRKGRVSEMLEQIRQSFREYRRRRAIAGARRQFAKVGYPLNALSDSQVEAALTNGEGEITDVVLSAKIIHHALRRLLNMRPQQSAIAPDRRAQATGPAPRAKGRLVNEVP